LRLPAAYSSTPGSLALPSTCARRPRLGNMTLYVPIAGYPGGYGGSGMGGTGCRGGFGGVGGGVGGGLGDGMDGSGGRGLRGSGGGGAVDIHAKVDPTQKR
jgi:hypothetical protein